MNNFQEILYTFHGGGWVRLLRSAVGLCWVDWETDSIAFGEIYRIPELLAEKIASHSDTCDIDIARVLRNAIAEAPKDQLPLARLVVLLLIRKGLITENQVEWLASFPAPTPFETFISERLAGQFNPTVEAFASLVCVLDKEETQFVAIKNVLNCLAPISGSAKSLFERLVRSGVPEEFPTVLLLKAISLRAQSEPLDPDIGLDDFASLPKALRIEILSETQFSRMFLMPATIARINSDPLAFPDTPETIQSKVLVEELTEELADGRLSGYLLSSLLHRKLVCEAVERSFDWSILRKISKPIKFDRSLREMPSFNEFRYRTSSGKLFSNLVTLALSGWPEFVLPKRESDVTVARQLVCNADHDVLQFAISKSKGTSQFFLLQCICSIDAGTDLQRTALDSFFATINISDVLPRSLNLAMRFAAQEQQAQGYAAAFLKMEHCAALLSWNVSFSEWFIARLLSGEFPGYVNSPELFRTYNTLGEFGVRIVEALLKHRKSGQFSQRSILLKVLNYAPGLSAEIFKVRHIRLEDFVSFILSPSFKTMGEGDQRDILCILGRRGKSALQLAFENNRLTGDFVDWLAHQNGLKQCIARNAPEILPLADLPLSDVLVGLTRRPSLAMKLLSGIDRSKLVEALPTAMSNLEGKSRIGAALELAIRSDISALSHFMRLAEKLAPPFEKNDFGHRFDELYSVYEIPKRSGGVREIAAPAPHLKTAQRALMQLLYDEGVSEYAMGFVPGRGIRDNAARHVGQEIVVNADVRAFFPSTTYRRVYSLAHKLCDGQLSPLSARFFAEICCHAGHLATGAPTSPAVSNLILRDLDARIGKIADSLGVRYSRYADDLTFSGQEPAVWMLKPARTFLARLGYELDPKKTNIFRKGRRQIVTGVVVNEKVNMARSLRKELRAAVDHRARGRKAHLHGRPLTDAMLNGHLSYLRMLSPDSAAPLIEKLKGASGWAY